jgi:hypothetical protein
MLFAGVVLKPVPVIVTAELMLPVVGLKVVIVGCEKAAKVSTRKRRLSKSLIG